MMQRIAPLLAIAERDIRMELRTRRGLWTPVMAALLLIPLATAPPITRESLRESQSEMFAEEIVEHLGQAEVRRQENEDAPVIVVPRQLGWTLPGRSILIALMCTSMLTGPLAQAIPRERTMHTWETLLTAPVSRRELLAGKNLAWSSVGILAAMLASALAVGFGRQDAGWWLLAMPFVPIGAVTIGLFSVRRAADVVGGATIAMRTLPVVIALLTGIAYMLGEWNITLGALVPLGGAVVAAGGTWPGFLPVLLAITSTVLGSTLLAEFTRSGMDIDRSPDEPGVMGKALVVTGLAATAWWLPTLGPKIWGLVPDAPMNVGLSSQSGTLAASLGLLVLAAATNAREPWRGPAKGWRDEGVPLVAASLLAAILCGGATWFALGTSSPVIGASDPRVVGPMFAILAAISQETLFRGLLRQQAGAMLSGLSFVLVIFPTAPLAGAMIAVATGWLTRISRGHILPSILARSAGVLIAMSMSAIT